MFTLNEIVIHLFGFVVSVKKSFNQVEKLKNIFGKYIQDDQIFFLFSGNLKFFVNSLLTLYFIMKSLLILDLILDLYRVSKNNPLSEIPFQKHSIKRYTEQSEKW
jgi:hypothetical protein